jgi:hypothetical protein
MRYIYAASAALLGLSAISALAQSPSPDLATGARPGHEIGVGDSLPRSNNASNIGPSNSRSTIAPTLPPSTLGENAAIRDYLTEARISLIAGRTGQAQQSLEMAETRALDQPGYAKLVSQIRDARQALGAGNRPNAIAMIDLALAG